MNFFGILIYKILNFFNYHADTDIEISYRAEIFGIS